MVNKRTLIAFLKKCRKEKLALNEITFSGEIDLTYYGAPGIVVVEGATWNQVVSRPWDHSMEALEEAVEIAETLAEGWVSITYPVMTQVFQNEHLEEIELDDGFEVMVWPRFALRTHNDFTDISLDNDDE